MLEFTYKNGRGRVQLNLENVLPCSASDMRKIISFIDLSDDPEKHATTVYHFISDRVNELKEERESYDENSAAGKENISKVNALMKRYLANAAALVAVTFVPGESGYMGDTPADELGEMWGAYDCGLASSYFILAAKNHGWDTLIMGIRDTAKVKAILGIPAKEVLMSVIAVGKSAQPYFKNPRKPVAEVLKAV